MTEKGRHGRKDPPPGKLVVEVNALHEGKWIVGPTGPEKDLDNV